MDLESLLKEVSPDEPSGADLEYDPAYGELERAAEGKPEQQLGDSTLAGEPSDWKLVKKSGTELLAKSKDIRIAILLARALTNLDGIAGLSQGLALVVGLLDNFWDTLHPQLDPDDGNDPTIRVNTLATLCDRDAMLLAISQAPLVSVKGFGSFGLRDVQIARGEVPAPEDSAKQVPEIGVIGAAFMDCEIEELKNTADAISASLAHLNSIDSFLTEKIGSAQTLDFTAILQVLNEASSVVNENLGKRGEAVESSDEGETAAENAPQGDQAPLASGEITSRGEAARMMDKIADYFKKNEPSSPVPLLMQRAKRLSSLGFMEILKDIAPDGLTQAQNIGGINTNDK